LLHILLILSTIPSIDVGNPKKMLRLFSVRACLVAEKLLEKKRKEKGINFGVCTVIAWRTKSVRV